MFDAVFNVGLALAIVITVVSLGIALTVRELVAPLARPLLPIGMVVLNCGVLPAVAWGIAAAGGLDGGALTGVTLATVGAAGAAGLKAVQLSGQADAALAVSLVVVLQLVNLVTVPLWAGAVVEGATLDRGAILLNLAMLILIPLAVGLVLRALLPERAPGWRQPLVAVSNVALGVALLAGIIDNRSTLVELLWSPTFLVCLAIVAACSLCGLALGAPRGRQVRVTTALVTGVRFAALGLIIIGTQLDGAPEILGPALVFGLVNLIMMVGIAVLIGRRPDRRESALTGGPGEVTA